MCQRTWRRWRMRSTQQCQTWKTNCQTWYLRVKYRPELTHITRYNRVIICSVRNPDFVFTFFILCIAGETYASQHTVLYNSGGGEAAFTSCIGHRWRKTKEQKPWNNTKHIFPWTENKEVFCFTSSGHLCPVHEVLTEKPKFVGCKIRGMRSWLVFLLFGVFTPLQWRTWTRDFDFYVLDVCICLWKYSSMSRSKAF